MRVCFILRVKQRKQETEVVARYTAPGPVWLLCACYVSDSTVDNNMEICSSYETNDSQIGLD